MNYKDNSLENILIDIGVLFKYNKISIPSHIKHIKIDIGLSYHAPQSQRWLESEEDLFVFGFEPNPRSVKAILSPDNKLRDPGHGVILDTKYINKNIYIIPVALGNVKNTELNFYITEFDEGCSSIYEPKTFFSKTNEIIKVPVFTLADFFVLVPDNIKYIEYIKIDAQGSDLNIIKGGGNYISEKVVYVTLEPESHVYNGCNHNTHENIKIYMESIGFKEIQHPNTTDPTFVNLKYIRESYDINISQY